MSLHTYVCARHATHFEPQKHTFNIRFLEKVLFFLLQNQQNKFQMNISISVLIDFPLVGQGGHL